MAAQPVKSEVPMTPFQNTSMEITKVVALGTESYSMNGVHKTVHCVVKNHPLEVHLRFKNRNAHQIGIDAELRYDSEQFKPVDYVRVRPMEVKTRFLKDSSEAVVVSTIRCLSSQHEDMFFRISYTCIDRETGQPIPDMFIYSPPVKVISKPEQLNKPKERQKRKRPLNQEIVHQLQRIEQHQMECKAILNDMANGNVKVSILPQPLPDNSPSPRVHTISNMFSGLGCASPAPSPNQMMRYASPVGSPDSSCGESPPTSPMTPHHQRSPSPSPAMSPPPTSPEENFRYHLQGLIGSFYSFAPGERPMKIRKIVQECDTETTMKAKEVGNSLSEFDKFISSGVLSDSFNWDFEPFPPVSGGAFPPGDSYQAGDAFPGTFLES